MKHFAKSLLSLFLTVGMLSVFLSTSAMARSSAYLDGYRVVMTPESNGRLVISADVSGVGRLPEIGVKTIYVFESRNGEDFTCVKTYESSDYPEMMGSGSFYYEDIFTYQGKVGYYYYVKAFVYAGDSNGGDERSCNSAIKQARA